MSFCLTKHCLWQNLRYVSLERRINSIFKHTCNNFSRTWLKCTLMMRSNKAFCDPCNQANVTGRYNENCTVCLVQDWKFSKSFVWQWCKSSPFSMTAKCLIINLWTSLPLCIFISLWCAVYGCSRESQIHVTIQERWRDPFCQSWIWYSQLLQCITLSSSFNKLNLDLLFSSAKSLGPDH